MELGKPQEQRRPTPFSDIEGMELIYVFTHPCEEIAKELDLDLLDPMGAAGITPDSHKAWRRKCLREIGLKMDATVAMMISTAISEQVGRSIATALSYGKETPTEDGALFTPPPPEPMTGSVGGSPTAAASSDTTRK